MTPQAKAEELRKKYLFLLHDLQAIEVGTNLNESSKKLASICCDEIMSVIEQMDEDRGRKEEFRPLAEYSYWDLVKQHIQSL